MGNVNGRSIALLYNKRGEEEEYFKDRYEQFFTKEFVVGVIQFIHSESY